MTINDLLYDHQKALLQFQHSNPPQERELHWPQVVLAASKLKEWREANGVLPRGGQARATPLGMTPSSDGDVADVEPRGSVKDWESEGGALAHDGCFEPPSDFIVISAGQFVVGQTQFDNLSDAIASTRRC